MRITDLQNEIISLKEETNSAVFAHTYQSRGITEIADVTGDSFLLSVEAQKTTKENIILCGVRFMAETAKMLNPEKRVFTPNPAAGCPMAEQFSAEEIKRLKANEPDRVTVAYINTSAELKKLADICVTSSSAVKIVSGIEADKILFIPDKNLGDYVKKRVPQKDIMMVSGGCPFHASANAEDLRAVKKAAPKALLLAHPECDPAIVEAADYVGSTTGIINYAVKSEAREFIIGTEISVREHLQHELPDKTFYALSQKICCPDMRLTSLADVRAALLKIRGGDFSLEVKMSEEDINEARRCVDEMIRLGG